MDKKSDEKVKKNNDNKGIKILVVILLSAFVLLAAFNALSKSNFNLDFLSLFGEKENENKDNTDKNIYFYPIDYDENIFEDPEYLAQNHYFIYTENDTSTYMIKDSDYLEGGLPVAMFRQYFDAIINGDSEAYNSFFTADYIKENDKKQNFTMQKVYDISVEKLSTYIFDEGTENEITKYEFRVTYKILKNNGTFRSDVGSNAAVPEVYVVLHYGANNTIKINSINKYQYSK